MVEEPGEEYPTRRLEVEPAEGKWDDVQRLHEPVLREHERPRDGFEPVPVWLIFLYLGFAGWGGWYLGAYAAGFRADVIDIIPFDQVAVDTAPRDDAIPAADLDPMVLGERTYANCLPCHQSNGQGLPGTFPPLVGTDRVLEDPRPFAALILRGLEGPNEVDGVVYDGVMPGWAQLGDEEIAAVMTYVRQSFGNDAEAVAPSLVAQVREATADRTEAWTDPELTEFVANYPWDDLEGGPDEDEPQEEDEP